MWRTCYKQDKWIKRILYSEGGYLLGLCSLKWDEGLRAAIVFAFVIHDTPAALTLAWVKAPGGHIIPVHVLEIQKEKVMSWDYVCKLILVFFMGDDCHCSVNVSVMYWCDSEFTLCLGISLCFLLTTPLLSICEPTALLTYGTTVTDERLLNRGNRLLLDCTYHC